MKAMNKPNLKSNSLPKPPVMMSRKPKVYEDATESSASCRQSSPALLPIGEIIEDHCDSRKEETFTEDEDARNLHRPDQPNFNKGIVFCEKVRGYFCNTDDFLRFLKYLHYYNIGIIEKTCLRNMVAYLLGNNPQLLGDFDDLMNNCEEEKSSASGFSRPKKHTERKDKVQIEKDRHKEKKDMVKSIQELDLSNCENCTPSYWVLPQDYHIPQASERTKLDSEVLNDQLVCRPSIMQDYSLKRNRLNKHEEVLFKCEDDKYELDMLIGYLRSAESSAKEMLNRFKNKEGEKNSEIPIRIEDHFSAQNLRCIEKLYGDDGLEVLDVLRKRPLDALFVILRRLKQQKKSLKGLQSELDKLWAKVYAEHVPQMR
ncbi:hypothetical protein P3X46_027378 [Hevea brasiliensis]|uniref:Histone deacetylase interacting domain-containing protein n=1 Tax=Hevea brasiliensis TaxID=3981 RepID=A0ABQ9L2N9_HEVBR|nr:hypothetical protein P3X46_027378 [Hevea brasiliensis]